MPRKKQLKRPQPEWLEGGYKPRSRGQCYECGKHVYKKPYYFEEHVFHQKCFRVWFKRKVKKGVL